MGTDGFGRSDGRAQLRGHFEVDAKNIVVAALYGLSRDGFIDKKIPSGAVSDLNIDPEKINPLFS